MDNLVYFLKSLGLYFAVLFSFLCLVKGVLEFKVYMSFENKDVEILRRVISFITFGITNLTFILYKVLF